jgi:endonuclease/exonuclease/phosphatase (EEP) superfamily protein YafD
VYRKYLPWHIDQKNRAVAVKLPKTEQLVGKKIVLLNWNVHKNNHALEWLEDFSKILHRHTPDMITFQEYQTMNKKSILDNHHEYGYGFFPNIVWKQNHFGLINASKSKIVNFDFYMTKEVEPIIKTPKITLETTYKMESGESLRVINVHMINFVKIKKFLAQVEQIESALAKDENPVILSGDFNTWNKKRMHIIERLTKKYSLNSVDFSENRHQKVPFPYPLDHIFYKKLKLQKAEVLSDITTSDHKPLLVVFSSK